jgi:hypothetical protein
MLGRDDVAERERRIRRWRSACGCGTSAAFLISSLLGYLALVVCNSPWIPHGFLRRFGVGLLSVLTATVAGKILGITYARIRLRREVAALNRVLATQRSVRLDPTGGD